MERLPAPAMPATLTAEALRRWLSHDTLPLVEIQSLDMGYYIVPFHHREGVLTGQRAPMPWSDYPREPTPSATQRLACGTRVAFMTR
ncbi:hypothetical protein QLQ86_06145 [Halomonas sp. LR5S13]|uniref:hypothetical protein n=1 Tax=Halomonas rhizosphaerae TaxID=3043296 RepID=UPI0024A8D43A|nr:hypothetical protein [Halomonas rhizosphaerae]MDI5920363.1 hypothetical protein [Halomonas rhizosphaerae]